METNKILFSVLVLVLLVLSTHRHWIVQWSALLLGGVIIGFFNHFLWPEYGEELTIAYLIASLMLNFQGLWGKPQHNLSKHKVEELKKLSKEELEKMIDTSQNKRGALNTTWNNSSNWDKIDQEKSRLVSVEKMCRYLLGKKDFFYFYDI